MYERTTNDGLARLRMAHGKVSALDLELLQALTRAFRDEATSSERALVLTGTGGTFSAGVDLARLLAGGADYTATFLAALGETFEALFTLPKPVVAAVNGHAIAGGCILALACDVVVMADGRGRIGVPELSVGVPFPPLALEILRARLAPTVLQRAALRGEAFTAPEALALGFVDALVAPEELEARAIETALVLASVPTVSYALTKRLLREPSLESVRRQDAAFCSEVRTAWGSPEVHSAIRRRLEALKGPR
jgi:enoyl-CoA hydratase